MILGVSGGIAAYKACELCRLLVRDGHDVTPLLTPEAETFVSAKTFEALARKEMPRDLYPHLVEADLLVIAPLTANTLAKLANGLADSVLAQAVLAFRGPVLAAPAMNVRMWEHPATQENAARLRERGVELIGPEEGELAEGESGLGRMTEPEEIHARVPRAARTGSGLSRESACSSAPAVRASRSTPSATSATARPAGWASLSPRRRGGAAPTSRCSPRTSPWQPPAGVAVVETPTAAELAEEALARADADVVLMAAAVADYRPVRGAADKRSKDAERMDVELEPTEDVLAELGRRRSNGQVLVGFAADHGTPGLERARAKLVAKAVDLVVFNDVSRADIGFDAADNEVVIFSTSGERAVGKAPKSSIAAAVLDEVERLLA